jgi:hypothetical protein
MECVNTEKYHNFIAMGGAGSGRHTQPQIRAVVRQYLRVAEEAVSVATTQPRIQKPYRSPKGVK